MEIIFIVQAENSSYLPLLFILLRVKKVLYKVTFEFVGTEKVPHSKLQVFLWNFHVCDFAKLEGLETWK